MRPAAMIGHSIGEYVAACLAGVFSLEEGLALVAARGRLMQQLPGGAMLSVRLPASEAEAIIGPDLSLASINAPSYCAVSGPGEAIAKLEERLIEHGVQCRRLRTSHAFHSHMMDPILDLFREDVAKIDLQPPQLPFISNVSGTWITAAQATSRDYWVKHVRQTVLFEPGLREVRKPAPRILLEIGPGDTLRTLVEQQKSKDEDQIALASLPHAQARIGDCQYLQTTLGQLWSAGANIDWDGYYTHERRRRLPLPTYPFERRRYWIGAQQILDEGVAAEASPRAEQDIAKWFYEPVWEQSNSVGPSTSGGASSYLIFLDQCGVGAALEEELDHAPASVTEVIAGRRFEKLTHGTYVINPEEPNDYITLLNELSAEGTIPDEIVHLWGVTDGRPVASRLKLFDETQKLGFYSLLFLAQALGRLKTSAPINLRVVTNSMQKVADESLLYPEKATILGPCRCMPVEYKNISCQSIDLVLPERETFRETQKLFPLVRQLAGEIRTSPSDPVIAYRNGIRWTQNFVPLKLDDSTENVSRLRDHGVYLITGGLGGVGLTLARHLAQTRRAKLILVSRSEFPSPEEWEGWLQTHPAQDEVSGRIKQLQEMIEAGGEVLVAQADVTQEEQMREAVARGQARFGQIHGVIHAAGVPGDGVIQLKTLENASAVLGPKGQGTLVL